MIFNILFKKNYILSLLKNINSWNYNYLIYKFYRKNKNAVFRKQKLTQYTIIV